jgi:hypothetical protein
MFHTKGEAKPHLITSRPIKNEGVKTKNGKSIPEQVESYFFFYYRPEFERVKQKKEAVCIRDGRRRI